VLSGLMLTAFLMGLGGIPHCAAMCGAACAAALPRGVPPLALLGRCVGYALLGALAAASAAMIAHWGRQVAVLQPFWVLAQLMAAVVGIWLFVTGQMPQTIDRLGQAAYWRVRQRARQAMGEQRAARWRKWWPFLAGLAWAALPCGLLYGALMVAALASDALGGGLVMLSFALPSALGVWGAPAVLGWLARRSPGATSAANGVQGPGGAAVVPVIWLAQHDGGLPAGRRTAQASVPSSSSGLLDPRWAVRAAGLSLAGMAIWGLSHHLMVQWRAWCA
jgi:sulfite exporter TauE/SafE